MAGLLEQLLGMPAFGGAVPSFDSLDAEAMRRKRNPNAAFAAPEVADTATLSDMQLPPHLQPGPAFGGTGMAFPQLGAGMLSNIGAGGGPQLPPSTNDPESSEPVILRDDVPVPRPRPIVPNTVATDVSSQSAPPAAPFSIAPPATPAQQGGGVGGFLGNLFKAENAPLFLSLAGGFSGAPSLGTGMRRAFSGSVPAVMNLRKEQLSTGNQAQTYQALIARGVPPVEAMAALRNPELMKALVSKYFETGKPITVGDRLVREKPGGGGVEVLADFSDSNKNVPSGYQKAADGRLTHIPGGPADPEVKRALGERQNAPPGYRWVDPADPAKGLLAIPGGPGEKVDAQVAARLGMAQSFLDQLPEIKREVARGEATGLFDAAKAKLGYGEAGKIRRRIDSGAEALLRNLTGAGMNMQEAAEYVRRYKLQPHDTVATVTDKLDQLDRELRYTMEAVSKGRGGTPDKFKVGGGKLTIGEETTAGLGLNQETEIDGVRIKRVK